MDLFSTFFNIPVLMQSLPQLMNGLLVTIGIGATSIIAGLIGGLLGVKPEL